MDIALSDRPRSLRDQEERERRRALLNQAHVAPLAALAKELRKELNSYVPDFDPLDGEIHAKFLFLFEKPGPKTAPPKGSGFISRNNDDVTAESTFAFMKLAGFDRQQTAIWNVIPAWNGKIQIVSGEVRAGHEPLLRVIGLLNELTTVIFVGAKAATAEQIIAGRGLKTFKSSHPSPKVKSIYPAKWNQIPEDWRVARLGTA